LTTDWLEIAVAAPAEVADDLAGLLALELGDAAAGIEQRQAELVFWVTPERAEPALAATKAALRRLSAGGLAVDPEHAQIRPAVPESEWRDAWKRYFKVIYLTRQLVVVPSWETHQPGPDDRVLHLDPGQAFGTGAHASTRLVLEELQHIYDEGRAPRRVLDVGTGSGILSIAAARLWPTATVAATDNDPIAVTTALENVARNQVEVSATTDDLPALPGDFDLVLANIQANVLEDLCPELIARMARGGDLVMSGLLTPQAPEIGKLFAARGLELVAIRPSLHDAEWSSVRMRRP
jgi:ribosomal protein L11 methyltransferase